MCNSHILYKKQTPHPPPKKKKKMWLTLPFTQIHIFFFFFFLGGGASADFQWSGATKKEFRATIYRMKNETFI